MFLPDPQDVPDPVHRVGAAAAVAGGVLLHRWRTSSTTPVIPQVARLGALLRRWRSEVLGYFATDGASNGGTEAATGSSNSTAASPAARATARTNRLRMLLIAGGLPNLSNAHP